MGCLKTPSCDLGRLPRSSSHGVFVTHWMLCPNECGHQQSNVLLSINYEQKQIRHSRQANIFNDEQNNQQSTINEQSTITTKIDQCCESSVWAVKSILQSASTVATVHQEQSAELSHKILPSEALVSASNLSSSTQS